MPTTNRSIPAFSLRCDSTVDYGELFYLASDQPTTYGRWRREPFAGNLTVLRGLGDSNVTRLPDSSTRKC
ncbi:hypothetical protein J7438_00025 [Thalassotalea sp. G20_0]|uniref:hypothetical protein n=1 Tax=Thalassotalea sp. G20_0 TaxID=2821093 RepID=UPI001ADC319C|nr:hypothetical protein [Thalassotalea sp. G20_0]MBO9492486.1 hypothetical protein [Thalassotalea sp. G20_0]